MILNLKISIPVAAGDVKQFRDELKTAAKTVGKNARGFVWFTAFAGLTDAKLLDVEEVLR